MTRLTPADITVFAVYMAFSIGVGVWFTRQQKDLKSYLLAGQSMHYVLVAVSVLAALFSGITYLGAPSETFHHDLAFVWMPFSLFIATPITAWLFLPFFYNLKLYTAYEYLEKRFDGRIRRLASALFILRVTLWLALAVFAPSLAIAEATGLPLWLSILLTGASTTLYTALGGMKAVIWTDTLQFVVLCVGIVFVLGFAIAAVPGGVPAAWALAAEDGRTRLINLQLNPTVRVTLWATLIGGAAHHLVQMVTDQVSVQRYLTAPSLKESQRALWFKLWITVPLVALFYLTGPVLYGFYKAVAQEVPMFQKPDSLLPHFVVNYLPAPLPGLLIAAIFAATMSTVSAGINSLTAVTLVDFCQPITAKYADRGKVWFARCLTALFGVVTTFLGLFVGRLGTLVEAPFRIFGLLGGPLLGIFFLGVLSLRANGWGALIGALGGAAAALLALRLNVSFLWFSLTGAVVTFALGHAASLLFAGPHAAARALTYRGTPDIDPTRQPKSSGED